MRVLVTGSSGWLGSRVAALLAERHDVVGLDLTPGAVTTALGSVTDSEVVRRAVTGVDAVVHTAALHAPHVRNTPRRAFVETNIGGTLNLLEAAVASGVRRFVYTSSTSVYGFALEPTDRAVWVTEEVAPRPRDIYDVTKLAAEELCRDFGRSGLGVVCLRVARCFPEAPETAAVHLLSRAVDVRDAAAAHVLAVESSGNGGVFNVAAASPFDPGDTVALLDDAAGVIALRCPEFAAAFAARGWPLPGRIERVYTIGAARAGLGYRPRFDALAVLESGPGG